MGWQKEAVMQFKQKINTINLTNVSLQKRALQKQSLPYAHSSPWGEDDRETKSYMTDVNQTA